MTRTINPMKLYHEMCRETRAKMSELIDGELDPRDARQVTRHARWCPNCRWMLKDLQRTVEGVQGLSTLSTPVDEPRA